MKLLTQIIRWSHPSEDVNKNICDDELAKVDNLQKRIKVLKTENELSCSRIKSVNVSVRKMFNNLIDFDICVVDHI